jgi:hypothetical protein
MLGLSKKESEERLKDLNDKRKETFKETVKEMKKNDPNFTKSWSHQCLDFWLKKGYSEEEAKKEVDKALDNMHKKTWEKRKEHPELYLDVNTTQIGYWVKKGYTLAQSRRMISDRQKTFTLDKCIKKYGEVEGTNVYNERNFKWNEKMKKLYSEGKYVKYDFNNKFYSKIEKIFVETLIEKMNLSKEDVYCLDKQYYFMFSTNDCKKRYFFDFLIKGSKKIIEFNGDFWHCNPNLYESNYHHLVKKKFASEIWEEDQLKINTLSIAYGGGVRVGLEDNIYYDFNRNKLATNSELLKRIHHLSEIFERKIMSSKKFGEKGFYNKERRESPVALAVG